MKSPLLNISTSLKTHRKKQLMLFKRSILTQKKKTTAATTQSVCRICQDFYGLFVLSEFSSTYWRVFWVSVPDGYIWCKVKICINVPCTVFESRYIVESIMIEVPNCYFVSRVPVPECQIRCVWWPCSCICGNVPCSVMYKCYVILSILIDVSN
jgi:hypothetical protein